MSRLSDNFRDLYRVWKREFGIVAGDVGVLVFFLLLPTVYPLVYTLIYNPETVRDIPVAVVDDCRTCGSREFVRMADATEAIKVIGYAADMEEARRWLDSKDCYGILYLPHDFSRAPRRGEQAVAQFYCEMSLLLRYRAFLSALTDLSLASGSMIREEIIGNDSSPVDSRSVLMGDTTQGFASFVIPGILVLIIQQSLILGIAMLGGGERERRRGNNGIDPQRVDVSVGIMLLGRALCYFTIYIPLIIYACYFIPVIFDLPHTGQVIDWLALMIPFVFASIFFCQSLQAIVTERESSMVVVVFSSVLFLFLSGITWPRYAMPVFWQVIGGLVPSTWGVEAFVRINSNGATLGQNMIPYAMLWCLCVVYFVVSLILHKKPTVSKK